MQYRRKKSRERKKKGGKSGSAPAVSNPHWEGHLAGAGSIPPGHSESRKLTLAYLYSTRFPVPHRQSLPSRISIFNKTPLMTSARKFKLRMTTRHTIYHEFCDLQCDFSIEKRAPKRGGSTVAQCKLSGCLRDILYDASPCLPGEKNILCTMLHS